MRTAEAATGRCGAGQRVSEIRRGSPRVAISHDSRSSTTSLFKVLATSVLRHSRVCQSTFTLSESASRDGSSPRRAGFPAAER